MMQVVNGKTYPDAITDYKSFDELRNFLSTGDYKYIRPPRVSEKTIGRNEPCSCGSGLKFKKCCGR